MSYGLPEDPSFDFPSARSGCRYKHLVTGQGFVVLPVGFFVVGPIPNQSPFHREGALIIEELQAPDAAAEANNTTA